MVTARHVSIVSGRLPGSRLKFEAREDGDGPAVAIYVHYEVKTRAGKAGIEDALRASAFDVCQIFGIRPRKLMRTDHGNKPRAAVDPQMKEAQRRTKPLFGEEGE